MDHIWKIRIFAPSKQNRKTNHKKGNNMENIVRWINQKYENSRAMKTVGEAVYRFVSNHLGTIVVLAIFGITLAVVGHYGTVGFNWKWFVFFELPLYLFFGWVGYKIHRIFFNNKNRFGK